MRNFCLHSIDSLKVRINREIGKEIKRNGLEKGMISLEDKPDGFSQ